MEQVREAIAQGQWAVALDLLDADPVLAATAEGLELLAVARYGAGEFEAAVEAWEELCAHLTELGDTVGAARAAAMIAMYLMMDTGLMAPVRGWLKRAERLLEGQPEMGVHALIAMVRTYERFMSGDMDAARLQSDRAMELGDRFGVEPAVVIGRVASARVRIFDGKVDEGLELLDEVGTFLMTGRADPLTTGMMYCELICAAQGLALHDRAREWTEVMERWRHGAAFGGINGRCRVHRAEMFRVSGPGDVAEREALLACDELRPWMRREYGWPLVELGNIRWRRGDLDGALEAYRSADELAWSPQPGLALTLLAQGDATTARRMIDDAVAHPFRIPSKERPPTIDLCLAPLLDAQAEIAAAGGDAPGAAEAAAALQEIADRYPSRALTAGAALARARATLAAGDGPAAARLARDAAAAWAEIGAPFELARARVVAADALASSGELVGAEQERRAARAAFEEFGATAWIERMEGTPAAPPSVGEAVVATFRCEGDLRVAGLGGDVVRLRDMKGFGYVARLLAEPGREVHVLELVGAGARPAERGVPVLDDVAVESYRRRLREVDEDIDEATQMHDMGRLELARADRDYLVAELSRAVGLGGRRRSVGGSAERARTSVTRTVRYALSRLAEHHPALAAHLDQHVHTGTYCRYEPDALVRVVWDL